MSFTDRLKHAWDAFSAKDTSPQHQSTSSYEYGSGYYLSGGSAYRTDRQRLHLSTERSMIASLYNKIAIDVAAIPIKHAKVDSDGQYKETIDSGLENCLSIEANIDQTGRELIFDAVLSMFDEGCVAIVPVETSVNVVTHGSYDILELRTGKITQWYPDRVKVSVYNERIGDKQEIVLPKSKVAIVENPFYSVMNEQNSTLKRLIRKLALLDITDERNSSTKLDLIFKLPYTIKTPAGKKRAQDRREAIQDQLVNDPYGIAYIDATENVTQLNRPIENKLLDQINNLTKTLYSQLGITEEVFNGTADEQTTLNYYNSTIEPILSALTDEMKRKFLTKTARSQGQSIIYIRNPFKLVPVNNIADIADKFTRNEIFAPNDIRSIMGYKPVDDPRASELRNRNLNASEQQLANPVLSIEE